LRSSAARIFFARASGTCSKRALCLSIISSFQGTSTLTSSASYGLNPLEIFRLL
jgi:hypothetical protein